MQDTGERDITSLFPGVAAGNIFVSRTGPDVTLRFEAVAFPADGTQTAVGNLPVGYRPRPGYLYLNTAQRSSYSPLRGFRVSRYGSLDFYDAATPHTYYALAGWKSFEPFPVT